MVECRVLEPELHAKFIQICSDEESLYALDERGNVWSSSYDSEKKKYYWYRIGDERRVYNEK